MNRRDGDELYNLANDPNETTNVIAKHPEKAASMLKSITAWDESLPPLPRPAAPPKRKARTGSPSERAKTEGRKESGSRQARPAKTESASYPWQNYSGPLQQNWFELHDGLKNSQYIFETTKKGTVAFVGGSITGMPWRKKVMENLKRRFPSTEFKFILAGVGSTGTMYGSFRLDRDVIQKGKVDLLFEEAAVNDVCHWTNGRPIGSWHGRHCSARAAGQP